jgi:ATP-dependent RNA helicase RhlE
VRFDEATHLVLDEADRMLDMGFVRDVKKIAAGMPRTRQTVLFSATMPKEIEALAADLLNDPAKVEVAPQGTTVGAIEQRIVFTPTQRKRVELATLLGDPACERVIVFARTKHGADRVVQNLGKDGFRADAIHGNKAQNARQRALNDFKTGRVKVLVATDIAARGIDVTGITHVINYDLPDEAENYTHRIGRTGRNGADGVAITLCDLASEKDKLRAVEKLIRLRLTPEGAEPLPEREARPAPKSGKPAGGRRRRRRSGGGNGGGVKRAA